LKIFAIFSKVPFFAGGQCHPTHQIIKNAMVSEGLCICNKAEMHDTLNQGL